MAENRKVNRRTDKRFQPTHFSPRLQASTFLHLKSHFTFKVNHVIFGYVAVYEYDSYTGVSRCFLVFCSDEFDHASFWIFLVPNLLLADKRRVLRFVRFVRFAYTNRFGRRSEESRPFESYLEGPRPPKQVSKCVRNYVSLQAQVQAHRFGNGLFSFHELRKRCPTTL